MAKQIERMTAYIEGNSTEWLTMKCVYTVNDSDDTAMRKNGEVAVELDPARTEAGIHAAVKAAVESAEGI